MVHINGKDMDVAGQSLMAYQEAKAFLPFRPVRTVTTIPYIIRTLRKLMTVSCSAFVSLYFIALPPSPWQLSPAYPF